MEKLFPSQQWNQITERIEKEKFSLPILYPSYQAHRWDLGVVYEIGKVDNIWPSLIHLIYLHVSFTYGPLTLLHYYKHI